MKKRVLSMLIVICLVAAMIPATALSKGICPHHGGNDHDSTCGYHAGSAEAPCQYVCPICDPSSSLMSVNDGDWSGGEDDDGWDGWDGTGHAPGCDGPGHCTCGFDSSTLGGGHAPYCNGPGHCTCGAEAAPDPHYAHNAWKDELDRRARARALDGSWVTSLWTRQAVINRGETELRLFQDGSQMLMKESLEWIPETDQTQKKLTLAMDDGNPLEIEMRVTGKTFSVFETHKVAQISIVSQKKPGKLDFEVDFLQERYNALGYSGADVLAIRVEDLHFQDQYKDAAMEAYAAEMAKYQLYLLTASPEEREHYDKTGMAGIKEALERFGYSFTYSDYVQALKDGTREPTGKSEAELKELYDQYDQSHRKAIAEEKKLKKDWKAGNLGDEEFLNAYKEVIKKQYEAFEEMSLVQAELEVFHGKTE